MKTAWDLDGTIYHNFLELDFFGYIDRWGGREKVMLFNQVNPRVRLEDVKYVLTFRPEWMREMTERELAKHGIMPDLLLMNPNNTDVCMHESARVKAEILNGEGFDVYIDDDEIFLMKLQPLTRARCISVEEFYNGLPVLQ